MKVLLMLGVLMFLSHAGSRNHFNDALRQAIEMARTLARLMGCAVEALPHLDTLEKVLRRIDPEALEGLLPKLVRRLIRMKALDDWRVSGRFRLAIDGTGLYSFSSPHCVQCIETHHSSGVVTYSHKVLVAFLVSEDGYALPAAYEFIENPGTAYDKQDCEIKAFHRLEAKLKRFYPQTPFWLLLDALYADQNVMRACLRNGWNFAITFKPDDMSALWAEAQALRALSPDQAMERPMPKSQVVQTLAWINDLLYEDLTLSAIFWKETDKQGAVLRESAHLVGRSIDAYNAANVVSTARLRWRCENEGFNVLKNGGFALEHVYSRNPVASKGYFPLMLIAHLVQQLLTRGRLGTVFRVAFHTFLNYGRRLLDALKTAPLPPDLDMPGQIRLSLL